MTDTEFIETLNHGEKELASLYTKQFFGNAKSILEIGSGWGIFTRLAVMADPDIMITTIDKISELKQFEENTTGYEKRINRYVGDSKYVLKEFRDKSFDMVFIDGDHGYEGFKSDFLQAWRIVKDEGTIVMDDIFHKKNFENDYGILKALSELQAEYKFVLAVLPAAQGVGIISKSITI